MRNFNGLGVPSEKGAELAGARKGISEDAKLRKLLLEPAETAPVEAAAADPALAPAIMEVAAVEGGTTTDAGSADDGSYTKYLVAAGAAIGVGFALGGDDDNKDDGGLSGGGPIITDPIGNSPPVPNRTLGPQAASEGSAFNYTFPADAFEDLDGDDLTYTATLANGSPLPDWLDFNPETRTFSGTPEDGDDGVIMVVITASDGEDSSSISFGVDVDNTVGNGGGGGGDGGEVDDSGRPVVANAIPEQLATEGSAFSFTFDADTFSDPDGDPLTYKATLVNGDPLPGWLTFDAESRTFSGTPDGNSDLFSVRVTADDGEFLIADDFDIQVLNVNDAPTGTVTITGTATEGEELTASNTLADADGLGTITYQWQADGVDIVGATGDKFTLTQDEVGAKITVVASYSDGEGTAESVESAETAAVDGNNEVPTGSVTITGTAEEDSVLTASNDLADTDGLGTISYQWQADGVDIAGETGDTLTLTQDQVGSKITVVASYTDGKGNAESVASGETAAVANINDTPTGSVTITGTAEEDSLLTASNDLADEDELGTISYQWQADGVDIVGETGDTLTLTQDLVGSKITVVASYTDGQGTAESVTSSETAAVVNVNDAPTGSVTISGTVAEDSVLTASNDLADEDGLGAVSYQWQADGVDIAGETGDTLTLTQDHVGSKITVVASYTDGEGTSESVTSDETAAVTNVNDAPTGGVTITGTATEGSELSASNTLDDEDGLGTISYQWQADGVDIVGATGDKFTLTAAQVGAKITVVASYTDGEGTSESATSSETAAVANLNSAPTGDVTITGTAEEDSVLTASNTLADGDGLGTISYQWQADGMDIAGETGSTLTLTQDEVGAKITVVASYTDGEGTAESVASSETAAVANLNDAPTGSVTISGEATEGVELTALNNLADEDGMGTVSYQWQADGMDIAGATGDKFTLTQDEVGAKITVVASYTDGEGTAESVGSVETATVANVNDAPTGGVTITGTATEGSELSASNTLDDEDGLGTISYQWQADGVDIVGATGDKFTLTAAQVGAKITVVASYTDGEGTPESLESAETAAVTDSNLAPVISNVSFTTTGVNFTATDTKGDTLSLSSPFSGAVNNGSASSFNPSQPGAVTSGLLQVQDQDGATSSTGLFAYLGDGADNTFAGDGKNPLAAFGFDGKDTLTGGDLGDLLSGGAGNDTLDGGAGDDLIVGGADNDKMTGGTGKDTFAVGSGSDTITDFTALDDVFQLLGISLANQGSGTVSSLVSVGNANNTIAGADVVIYGGSIKNTESNTAVEIDTLLDNQKGTFNGGVLVVAYNESSSNNVALWYDPDADDTGSAVQLLATLTNATDATAVGFTAADFIVG